MPENTAGHHRVMNFNKNVSIPDAGDRTNNDPCYLMSSNDVLKLIKANCPEGTIVNRAESGLFTGDVIKLDYVTSGKEVINAWMVSGIIKEATTRHGWSEVKLIGKQLLFIK